MTGIISHSLRHHTIYPIRKIYSMIKYRRFQFGWVIVITFIVFIVWMTFAYIYQWGNNPIDKYGYILFLIIFGGVLLFFYGMTIMVTDKHLKIKFGIGLFTKKIDLATISSVTIQTNPVYYGYGIRIIPKGLLYNVSGKHAIEIKLKDQKKVIQIGTNDWDNLKKAIEQNGIKN
jgi:hypothetical protein